MIFQGLLNISSIYLDNEDSLFNRLDQFFLDKINLLVETNELNIKDLDKSFPKLLEIIKENLLKMGFVEEELENAFLDPFINIDNLEFGTFSSIHQLYDLKLAPIIYEIFLEKIIDYLVDINDVIQFMLNLKSANFLSLEFIVELRNLKDLLNKYPEKKEHLKKYLQIQDKLEKKLEINKSKIELLEDLPDLKEKLQLLYLIYRIISFFHLEKKFDFTHLKNYLSDNIDEWLITIPLVTLRNPDLYYCGLYLADQLNLKLDKKKVREFLFNLYEEGIDEFEAPIIQATDGVYYLLKATQYMKVWLTNEQLSKLIETDPKFFDVSYLKNLETSQLVVILKIYGFIHARNVDDNIYAILEELEQRITPEGIKQFRDGFVSSEATYYVVFCYYMRNTLEKLKEYGLLESIISRIYRNLELLEFSEDTNFDLISELLYSFENLKLFNCIETREMILKMAKYLFPPEIVEKLSTSSELSRIQARFRHLKVNRITGETNY
ncbi:MAG: hypothetical protein KGD67_05385 [Candidatus Lokiarchaeota archaeon]|nr:hypothetical protein [Candidatus Lokiarchaeota archaeon]